MRGKAIFKIMVGALALVLVASAAMAQVTGLYYKEVEKDGRIYVFNTQERFHAWEESGDMGQAITLAGRGAEGQTLVAENETALDLYLFKHNLPAYERPTPKPAAPAASAAPPPFPTSKLGIRVYADVSSKSNEDEATGVKSSDSGEGIDVKRTYLTFTHQFDAKWSAQFQSDIGDQGARRFDVFVKKAYIEYKPGPMAVFRLGSADTPWVPNVENLYSLRYIETTILDHLSFGTSAEWGFHVGGSNSLWGYAFTAGNGRSFSNPSRSKTVDFEGRLSFTPVKGLHLAVGGYSGKRGLETDTVPARHTATRANALVAYSTDKLKVGGEYFQTRNWNNVTTVPEDKADGLSTWAQFIVNPRWSVFGRYDQSDPSKDLNPDLQFAYSNGGLQWTLNKAFAASLVYKFSEVEGGTLSTSNGIIGSVDPNDKGTYREIGVFTVYNF
jgi:hypothetical protein